MTELLDATAKISADINDVADHLIDGFQRKVAQVTVARHILSRYKMELNYFMKKSTSLKTSKPTDMDKQDEFAQVTQHIAVLTRLQTEMCRRINSLNGDIMNQLELATVAALGPAVVGDSIRESGKIRPRDEIVPSDDDQNKENNMESTAVDGNQPNQ